MKRKGLIAIICSALILAMAVPGTLALAADESGSESLMTINACTCNTEDGIHTTDCSLYDAGEEPALSLVASSDTADATSTESDASDVEESNTADTADSFGTVVDPSTETTGDGVESNTVDTTSGTVDTTPAETEAKESATAPVCTCGATDSIHKEDCPLYENEAALYQKLIATKSQKEFDAIIAGYTEKNLVFTCEEFDNLEAHYYFLSTGKVLDRSLVVDEVSTTVNFTNVAPLIESGN